MISDDLIYRIKGIDPKVKKAYMVLFNSKENKERASKVIDDLIIRFKFFGAAPTNDPIQLAKTPM